MTTLDNLYPSIFKRKSIRSFKEEALSTQDLDNIKQEIESIESIELKRSDWMIDYNVGTQRYFNLKAPGYFVMLIRTYDSSLLESGFIMQQLDLICNRLGIATCWLGFNRIKESENHPGYYETIRLAVGYTSQDLDRTSVSQFNRLSYDSICNSHRFEKIIEAGRLAPSSVNNQPWHFFVDGNSIVIKRRKGLSISKILDERFLKINCGIALLHLVVALNYYSFDYQVELNHQYKHDQSWIARIHVSTQY
jgi:nitroreductase